MKILSQESSSDLFHLFCGEKLGEGIYREVFQHALDETRVIKLDNRKNWSNVHEFSMWVDLQHTELGKWMAPVYWMSPSGIWLIQAKTTPIPDNKLPKQVPAVFTDLKSSNWGMYKGRPVCHDYANNLAYSLAAGSGKRMKTANWF